jgi:prevent-host-death family protein
MASALRIRPISFLKANAAQILADLTEKREPMVITQNGEAKAVIQDVASFEETRQALALLKLIALGIQDIDAGRTRPAREVLAQLRSRAATD